jgi:hypothetical protein
MATPRVLPFSLNRGRGGCSKELKAAGLAGMDHCLCSHRGGFWSLETLLPKGKNILRRPEIAPFWCSLSLITHLILEKDEPFPIFILRRFSRIYPAYLVALLLAIATATMTYQVVVGFEKTPTWLLQHFVTQQDQFNNNFTAHLLAHLALLHGAVPNNILPDSQ